MPSESYSSEYPSVEDENSTMDKVQDAVGSEDWPRVCKEIGAITEMMAQARYAESQNAMPKNFHLAIEFIMNNKLIPRPLGAKMHLVRELRNVASHPKDPTRLPYVITKDDARITEQILMDLLSWIRSDKLREDWNNIVAHRERMASHPRCDPRRSSAICSGCSALPARPSTTGQSRVRHSGER
jgi:hypothetical protein